MTGLLDQLSKELSTLDNLKKCFLYRKTCAGTIEEMDATVYFGAFSQSYAISIYCLGWYYRAHCCGFICTAIANIC